MGKDWCIENDFAAQKELAAMEDYNIAKVLEENKAIRARVARLEATLKELDAEGGLGFERHALISRALEEK